MKIPTKINFSALLGLCVWFSFGTASFAVEASPIPSTKEEKSPLATPDAARDSAIEGNAAFSSGDYNRAREAYRRVLTLVPDNLIALTNLGLVEFAVRNPREAEKHLKRAVRIRMETSAAWLTLGTLYMDEDRAPEALAALTQAALYDPTNARVHNFLGVIYGRREWFDAAESELRRAVELDPNYADAHFNLAVFYLGREKPLIEPAKRHYFRAIDLGSPKDPLIEGKFKSKP